MRELVDLLFEEAKHSLIQARGDDLLRMQGEAQAMDRLHEKLTRASPSLKQE